MAVPLVAIHPPSTPLSSLTGKPLRLRDPALLCAVEVEAYDAVVGAVLSKRDPEIQKLEAMCLFSCHLSPAERNYDVSTHGLLTVIWVLQKWRHWLKGTEIPFLTWTDHINLSYCKETLLQMDVVSQQI